MEAIRKFARMETLSLTIPYNANTIEFRVKTKMMKMSITYRLFFSILSATGLAILSLFLLMWWNIDRGFQQYLNTLNQSRLVQMAEIMGQAYGENKSWDFLKKGTDSWLGRLLSIAPDSETLSKKAQESGKDSDVHGSPPTSSKGPARSRGPLVILDAEKKPIFGFLEEGQRPHSDQWSMMARPLVTLAFYRRNTFSILCRCGLSAARNLRWSWLL